MVNSNSEVSQAGMPLSWLDLVLFPEIVFIYCVCDLDVKKDLERLQTQTRDPTYLAKQLNEFLNVLVAQSCPTLPTRFLCLWNLPGMNARVGRSSLCHGIFLMRNWTHVFE